MNSDSDPEVKKYLKKIAHSNKWYNVMTRGCITGVFSAIGVLVGTGIIIVVGARILSTQQIPFLGELLESTKLDVLIESQVNSLTKGKDSKVTTYKNNKLAIEFLYPSELTTVQENPDINNTALLTDISGTGALTKLQLYKTNGLNIQGIYTSKSLLTQSLGILQIKNYQSPILNNSQLVGNIYVVQLRYNNQDLSLLAYTTPNSPKLGREVFYDILYSLKAGN